MNKLFQAIDNKDADTFATFLTDNATFRFGNAPVVQGRDTIKTAVGEFFASIEAISHSITDTWETPDSIVSHGWVTYTRLDNSTLTVPFCNVLKMNKVLIEEYLIFVDTSALYQM